MEDTSKYDNIICSVQKLNDSIFSNLFGHVEDSDQVKLKRRIFEESFQKIIYALKRKELNENILTENFKMILARNSLLEERLNDLQEIVKSMDIFFQLPDKPILHSNIKKENDTIEEQSEYSNKLSMIQETTEPGDSDNSSVIYCEDQPFGAEHTTDTLLVNEEDKLETMQKDNSEETLVPNTVLFKKPTIKSYVTSTPILNKTKDQQTSESQNTFTIVNKPKYNVNNNEDLNEIITLDKEDINQQNNNYDNQEQNDNTNKIIRKWNIFGNGKRNLDKQNIATSLRQLNQNNEEIQAQSDGMDKHTLRKWPSMNLKENVYDENGTNGKLKSFRLIEPVLNNTNKGKNEIKFTMDGNEKIYETISETNETMISRNSNNNDEKYEHGYIEKQNTFKLKEPILNLVQFDRFKNLKSNDIRENPEQNEKDDILREPESNINEKGNSDKNEVSKETIGTDSLLDTIEDILNNTLSEKNKFKFWRDNNAEANTNTTGFTEVSIESNETPCKSPNENLNVPDQSDNEKSELNQLVNIKTDRAYIHISNDSISLLSNSFAKYQQEINKGNETKQFIENQIMNDNKYQNNEDQMNSKKHSQSYALHLNNTDFNINFDNKQCKYYEKSKNTKKTESICNQKIENMIDYSNNLRTSEAKDKRIKKENEDSLIEKRITKSKTTKNNICQNSGENDRSFNNEIDISHTNTIMKNEQGGMLSDKSHTNNEKGKKKYKLAEHKKSVTKIDTKTNSDKNSLADELSNEDNGTQKRMLRKRKITNYNKIEKDLKESLDEITEQKPKEISKKKPRVKREKVSKTEDEKENTTRVLRKRCRKPKENDSQELKEKENRRKK